MPSSDPVAEQAASWYARLTGGEVTGAKRAEFEAWRGARQEHEAAFRRLLVALDMTDNVFADVSTPANVFRAELRDEGLDVGYNRRAGVPHIGRLFAVAASVLAAVGLAAHFIQSETFTPAVTRTGEQRAISLPDGSKITLNTETALAYAIDEDARRVRFTSGEAFFQIAPDARRPFTILVGAREVKVVGTQFNIRHVGDRTEVAVTEGTVRLSREFGWLSDLFPPETSQSLQAGQLASFTSNADVILRASVAPDTVATWREKRLIYRSETLGDVIADLDRYFTGKYVVDPAAASLKVSAVLHLSDEPSMLRALSSQLPLQVSKSHADLTEISLRH